MNKPAIRHVFVCTTDYADHWSRTIAKKKAQMAAMSEEEKKRILEAKPEEHADGHRGSHCGMSMGGSIYEMFQRRLREAGIEDVIVSPNACVAQHAYGCVVMVYPDGLWYRIHDMSDAEKILEQHIIGGEPVRELVHRRLNPERSKGIPEAVAAAAPASAAS
ncbi:MAG: hypothetical protein JJT85_07385 [Chromatiales bacterium]|nr:hypothetical protein [Chromatiales bacterium]